MHPNGDCGGTEQVGKIEAGSKLLQLIGWYNFICYGLCVSEVLDLVVDTFVASLVSYEFLSYDFVHLISLFTVASILFNGCV